MSHLSVQIFPPVTQAKKDFCGLAFYVSLGDSTIYQSLSKLSTFTIISGSFPSKISQAICLCLHQQNPLILHWHEEAYFNSSISHLYHHWTKLGKQKLCCSDSSGIMVGSRTLLRSLRRTRRRPSWKPPSMSGTHHGEGWDDLKSWGSNGTDGSQCSQCLAQS